MSLIVAIGDLTPQSVSEIVRTNYVSFRSVVGLDRSNIPRCHIYRSDIEVQAMQPSPCRPGLDSQATYAISSPSAFADMLLSPLPFGCGLLLPAR